MTTQLGNKAANQTKFPFILPLLPYEASSLEPHLSAKTFSFHHGKHHMAYVTNLNNLLKDTVTEQVNLEEIILNSANDPKKMGIFNNAGQIWNHSFYWHSMKQGGGGTPAETSAIYQQIVADFGSFDNFKQEFVNAGITQFGSGWAWLVLENGKLKVTKTANADLPLVHGQTAILTCDVWEHAYYLDYQNRRPDYLNIFLDHLVNWDFAEQNLRSGRG
jgi:Fe-Mn family superoxide dismutase